MHAQCIQDLFEIVCIFNRMHFSRCVGCGNQCVYKFRVGATYDETFFVFSTENGGRWKLTETCIVRWIGAWRCWPCIRRKAVVSNGNAKNLAQMQLEISTMHRAVCSIQFVNDDDERVRSTTVSYMIRGAATILLRIFDGSCLHMTG